MNREPFSSYQHERPRLDKKLYAHSLKNRPLDDWQLLDSHLFRVAGMAAGFAESFGSGAWAWNAGLLHDIGKAADEFQAYLRRENDIDDDAYDGAAQNRGNHSSAGSALAEEWHNQEGRPYGRILSSSVRGTTL